MPSSLLWSPRFRRLSREGAWILLGQGLAIIGILAGMRILTELLDPATYGELALSITLATLVNQIVFGPLGQGASRFYAPAVERYDFHGYLASVARAVSAASMVMILIMLLAVLGLAIADNSHLVPLIFLAFLFAILGGYNSILNSIQNAARQRSIVALHQGVEPWFRFILAAALLMFFGQSSANALGGYTIGLILVLMSQYIFFRKILASHNHTSAEDSLYWQRRLWAYSWPISIFGLFAWAQLVSDRWALEVFGSTSEVGLYAVLFQLGYYPVSLATAMAVQFFGPIFFARAGDATDRKRLSDVGRLSRRLTVIALVGTLMASALTYFLHEYIFMLFVAGEYGSVSYLLPGMVLAGGVYAAGQSIALNLMSQMRTRPMMFAKIGSALLGVGLNVAGAYIFGIPGIVVAMIAFSFIHFASMAGLASFHTVHRG